MSATLRRGGQMCTVIKTVRPAEVVIDQHADRTCLSVMLSEFGHWNQSLRIAVNRRTCLAVQKGSNRFKLILGEFFEPRISSNIVETSLQAQWLN